MRRSACAIAVLAALAVAVDHAPGAIRRTWDGVTSRPPSWSDRELAPAAAHGISAEALALAAVRLPRAAQYAIVVGNVPPVDPDTAIGIEQLFPYWLLPRIHVAFGPGVRWVITYHEPSEALGRKVVREIGLGPDANLVQVAP
jgi:hypothetical protein